MVTWSVCRFRLRVPSSAALNLCGVAEGSLDAYYQQDLHCWDIAAGQLVVREAGGVVCDVTGRTGVFCDATGRTGVVCDVTGRTGMVCDATGRTGWSVMSQVGRDGL